MDEKLTGLLGETYAARYLREEGCQIIASNVSNRFGEVDLIARDDEYIFFVEVKTRGPNAIASPGESVTRSKQRRICGLAASFLQNRKYDELQPRFDVIEVYLGPKKEVRKINHIKNAFESVY
ncbi:MAG: YraN family protein [Clostridiales bacterium]|nr:YraN family protein [Clostridiales bacterium]